MAVIQISKIQVRRGLQENLPQLAGGELGWSTDERRLFIGNGVTSSPDFAPIPGNTEILTQNSDITTALSYYFRGDESGYESITGPTATQDIVRTLQHKLDEQVSVRDFGAVGDGTTDDSLALQRAIDEVYPSGSYYNTVGVRRRLYVPAGTYDIRGNTLVIPSFVSLFGDGPLSTIIKNTQGNVTVKFRDSDGNVDGDLGTASATLPYQISFADIAFENAADDHIVVVDSANDISFDRVKFIGTKTLPTTVDDSQAAVRIVTTIDNTNRVTFNECYFTNSIYGIDTAGAVTGVVVNNSVFDTLFNGVKTAEATSSPQGIKIIASTFDNIAAQAIVSLNDSSTVSAYNYFKVVGYGNATAITSGTISTEVISWSNPSNYSIHDTFDRTQVDTLAELPHAINTSGSAVKLQYSAAGSAITLPGYTESLTDGTTANTSLVLTTITPTAIIDYNITRDNASRIGSMHITHYNGTVVYEDDYTEVGTPGVTLGFTGNIISNIAVLGYTTTSTGNDATFKYNIRSFI